MRRDLTKSCYTTAFDQILHHLYSTCAGGKHLSNDAQIRVIGWVEPEICTKMLKKLSEKLGAKFPANTPGCSIVKFARLDDAFLKFFKRKQAQWKVNHCSEKKRKGEKKNSKIEKPKDVGHFLLQKLSQNFVFSACPSQNVIKRDASGKNGELPCRRSIFDHIKANLAEIQPDLHGFGS